MKTRAYLSSFSSQRRRQTVKLLHCKFISFLRVLWSTSSISTHSFSQLCFFLYLSVTILTWYLVQRRRLPIPLFWACTWVWNLKDPFYLSYINNLTLTVDSLPTAHLKRASVSGDTWFLQGGCRRLFPIPCRKPDSFLLPRNGLPF